MIRRPILALAVAAVLNPLGASAVGVGDIKIFSALNEVLNAQISLHKVAEGEVESLSVSLASADAFAKAGLERPYYLTDLRFSTALDADGKPLIKVKSQNPIREPFLNFLVEVNWPRGKVMREFTLLLDPPTTFKRPAPQVEAVQSQAQPIPLEVRRPATGPSPTQPAGTDYRVETNDTLWSIANRYRPEGVSVQAMLMTIYRNNPHAFARNDMNLLLAGKTLKIPAAEALSRDAEREARSAYLASLADHQDAGIQASPLPVEPINARGELIPPPDATARLEIVTPVDEKAEAAGFEQSTMKRLEKDLMLARELNEKVSAENNELQQRLQRLESQLGDLERLLRLKSDSVAQIQQQAQQQAAQEEPSESPPEPVEEASALPADLADQPILPDEPAQPLDRVETEAAEPTQVAEQPAPEEAPLEPPAQTSVEPSAAETETPPQSGETPPETAPEQQARAETETQPQPQPQSESKPKPKAQPEPPQPEQDMLQMLLANPLLLPAAGGLLLLLLLLLLLKSRSKGQAEPRMQKVQAKEARLGDDEVPSFEDVVGSEAEIGDIEADEDAPQSSLLLDFTPSELEGMGADTEIDPVSEADVYVAYGRYNQALDLLREGMKNHPERSDIKIKLLEVLHAAGERSEFLRQAAQLANEEDLAKKDPKGWERVSVLGRQIEPEHPLFVGAAVAATASVSAALNADSAAADAGLDFSLPETKPQSQPEPEQKPELPPLAAQPPAEAEGLELDLEIEAQALPEEGIDEEPLLGPDQESGFGDDLLDLDDLEIPDLQPQGAIQPPAAAEAKPSSASETVAESSDQSIEIIDLEDSLDMDIGQALEIDEAAVGLNAPETVSGPVSEALASFEEDDVLGRDADRDEPQEPIIDLSNEADLQALKEIEAMSGAHAAEAEAPEGIFGAASEESLENLEAELARAADALVDRSSPEADRAALDEDLEDVLADLGADLEEGLDADNGDIDLESELSDLDMELSSEGGEVDLESELADLDKELSAGNSLDQELVNLDEMEAGLNLGAGLGLGEEAEDHAQTKLELAEAYVDMGDPEGARAILEEVLAEGSERQKAEAKALLSKLA
jgi:pilus assembly protein FimV